MKKQADLVKDIQSLQSLDIAELGKELQNAERELYLLAMKHKANELKQPHLIRSHRRYIAQIKMVISAQ